MELSTFDANNPTSEGDAHATLDVERTRTADQTSPIARKSEGVDRTALLCLTAQHFSSSWGSRSFEFAAYLYLIELFPDTILPASILGFFTTGAAILFAGSVGQLVDKYPRLGFVRTCIVLQKVTVALGYASYLILFFKFREASDSRGVRYSLLAVITALSAVLNIATIAISVSVERDWVTTIAQGDSSILTKLNAWLRRVDLLCKLLSPLFVSLLTTAVSYTFSVAFLLGLSIVTMGFEFFWINVVYRRWSMLVDDEKERLLKRTTAQESERPLAASDPTRRLASISSCFNQLGTDWLEFFRSPIFFSSLSISLIYMTVLSFDGSMISYLKSQAFSDPFIAGMRGIGVITGLIGTLIMPFMEKRIGVVRAGSWSILSEVLTLLPVLFSFFVEPGRSQKHVKWKSGMLFTGMALSRIGLWSFDLCQLKELQMALDNHPRKNSLMALQFSLQNIFDMIKYVLTMILSRPSEFRWAALASFIAVCLGAISYLWYARKERGHLVHLEWTEGLLGKKKL